MNARDLTRRVAAYVGLVDPVLDAVLACACTEPRRQYRGSPRVGLCPHQHEATRLASETGDLPARLRAEVGWAAHGYVGPRDDGDRPATTAPLVAVIAMQLRAILGPLAGTDAEVTQAAEAVLDELATGTPSGVPESP